MAINYTIQSDVINITSDTPKAEDVFLVDTNVWYWMTYPKAATSASLNRYQYQLSDYPAFVNKALTVGSRICHTGLSLAELSHLIEKTELEIYAKTTGALGAIKPKEYRHNAPIERSRVVSEVKAAWGQIKSLASPLAITIDAPATTAALNRLQNERVDGYDLFILETMRNHEVVQLITDDGDFSTISGIQVFTANRSVLSAARKQGKLLIR